MQSRRSPIPTSSSPTPEARQPDFGARASTYDELRPQDDNWWELYELVSREAGLRGERVLDAGCGTGRLVAALARDSSVWGIDASPEMLAVARERVPQGVRLKQARAEAPPFKAGWFDRVVYWLVVHLLDRPEAFRAAHRLLAPGGRACVVTFDSTYFSDYWLNRYFPRFEAIDRARFPTAESLEAELREAGFERVRLLRHRQSDQLGRDQALAKVAGRHISTFDLLEPEEYQEGRARVERELPDVVEYEIHWLVAIAER
jgi:ubiquinone/menaquinone biosynthesis C-methylase UbiE